MEINITGCGSIGAKSMNASTLIDGKILIDMPNGIVKHIKKLGYDTGKIETVLITHLHGDHFFDIPFLMFDRHFYKPSNKVKIYGPRGLEEKVKGLFSIGFPDDFERLYNEVNIEFVEIEGEAEIKEEKFIAYPKFVEHGNLKPAYGYVLEIEGKKIGFSGDSRLCESVKNIVKESDVSILDMSLASDGHDSHMGLNDIKYLCDLYKEKTIISTHMHEYTKEQALKCDIENLIVGEDNLRISL